MLRKLSRISIRAWIKRLGENEILLWDTNDSIKLKISCKTNTLKGLPCGSLVEIQGYMVNGELCIEEITVIHAPIREDLACIESIPSDPITYTMKYPVYVRHPEVSRSIKTYFYVVNYIRTLLVKRGFIELPTVILGYTSDPGLRGASKIQLELHGKKLELQSSMIMYKQLYASIFDNVFYVAKNTRLEPLENIYTGRHLLEFTQIDVESTVLYKDDVIGLAEKCIYRLVKWLLDKHSELFEYKDIERLEKEIIKPPYPRLTYSEAVSEARKLGFNIRGNQELSFESEVALASKYNTPVWIEGFPIESRGFYYIEDKNKPGYNVDYNLLLPGHGEILDGGCREYRYEYVYKRIVERHNEDPSKYEWFLELTKAGLIRPTCGWGLGVERLVKYLHNLDHIVRATPHPRIPGIVGP